MKKFFYLMTAAFSLIICTHQSWAGQVRAYVSGFAVTGAQNKDELKSALQSLLMSRLNNQTILSIDTPEGSDITVSGSYVAFGKIFSIDAAARNRSGSVVARAFVQGDSQDELIPAIGKLASDLTEKIAGAYSPKGTSQPSIPAPKGSGDIVREERATAAEPEIVRPAAGGASLVGQRIPGVMSSFAVGHTFADGSREIFVAGGRTFRYYRIGNEIQLVEEIHLGINDKILSIDAADVDGDGISEVYVTVIRGDSLASQIWSIVGGKLKKNADNLPYFFRGLALDGKEKKIYAQQINMDGDFYGDICEFASSDGKYLLKSPLKLPKQAYLYNFNKFTDSKGKPLFVLLNRDGYLLVFSQEGEELWRSSDKFGGTELYYQRPDQSSKSAWTESRVVFLDPRIFVSTEGEIIVPQNTGFWVVGNSRSYSKNAIYAFSWNGATLVEKWHTRQSQNYLADFRYDESGRKLLLLEVVKKEGLLSEGASAISTIKID